VPALFLNYFPSWFVGVAFAAIGIGALVPAAIMSIAAANLYTRNIHREFVNRNMTHHQETHVAKLVSLIVKVGAVAFILGCRSRMRSSCSCSAGSGSSRRCRRSCSACTRACSTIAGCWPAGRQASSGRGWRSR
jgi:Na+/proline symporter